MGNQINESLAPDVLPAGFFAKVAVGPGRLLLLDYDGTLAPFRPERDQAVPYPGVRERLQAIADGEHTRMVLISGRAVDDVVELLGMPRPPEIWGSHGLERRRPDGTREMGEIPDAARDGLEEARRWVSREGLDERLELKPGCVALHWRGLGEAEAERIRESGRAALAPLAERTGLALHDFDGGLELRVTGWHKGRAVAQLLTEVPEGAACAYLGDDRTDEDAFAALGERGLGVLVRTAFRPTRARAWLRPPEALLDFLSKWHQAASTP